MNRSISGQLPGNLSFRLTRRAFLKTSTLAVTGASCGMELSLFGDASQDKLEPGKAFPHRALNGWITDLATEPDVNAAWPSMRLDERLLQDYHETFARMRRVGFNEIVVWGLFVANHWPLDIKSAVTPERGRLVERLIDDAHHHGIKVLSGLGVYSWGFADIIRAHPNLAGGNPNALCPSQPDSQKWMERIIEFVFNRFPIDGVSMQSADQGRCPCARCAPQSDAEYHAHLISRSAQYIRSRWPDKILGMSNWGVSFGKPQDGPAFEQMSRSLDYLIDHNNSAQWGGPGYRQKFISRLACAYGTTGGPVVEPPQHWARDRWFLPTARRVSAHLKQLSQESARACEFFYHILANPSSEFTFHIAGQILNNPGQNVEKLAVEFVEEFYRPRSRAAEEALTKIFFDAEEGYLRHLPPDICSTISLEPLVNHKPGPPIYLKDRLNPSQRADYAKDLNRLIGELEQIYSQFEARDRMAKIRACLLNVRADLLTLNES